MKYILKHKKDKWVVSLTFFENGDLNIVEFPKDFLQIFGGQYGHLAFNLDRISQIVRENPTKLEFTIVPPDLSFKYFWELYDYKLGKKERVEKIWNNLSEIEKSQTLITVKKYKSWLQTVTTAQAYPQTFLNEKRWENEY